MSGRGGASGRCGVLLPLLLQWAFLPSRLAWAVLGSPAEDPASTGDRQQRDQGILHVRWVADGARRFRGLITAATPPYLLEVIKFDHTGGRESVRFKTTIDGRAGEQHNVAFSSTSR